MNSQDELLKVVPYEYVRNPDRRLYVYVFSCGDFIKVGFSADMERRENELRTANPHPVKLEACKPVSAVLARRVEASIHAALWPKHHQGEWFRCMAAEAKPHFRASIRAAQVIEREYAKHLREWRAAEALRFLDGQNAPRQAPNDLREEK